MMCHSEPSALSGAEGAVKNLYCKDASLRSACYYCFVHENAPLGGETGFFVVFLHENRPFRGEGKGLL